MVNTKTRHMAKKYHPYSKEDIKKYFIIKPNNSNNSNTNNTNNNTNNANNSNTNNRYVNYSPEWEKENKSGLAND